MWNRNIGWAASYLPISADCSGFKIYFRSLESDLVRITNSAREYFPSSTKLAIRLNCSLCRGENHSTRSWSQQRPSFHSVWYAAFLIHRRDRGFDQLLRVSVEAIDCGSRSASWWCRRIPNDWRNTRWCRRASRISPLPPESPPLILSSAGWIIN